LEQHEAIQKSVNEYLADYQFSDQIREIVKNIVSGIVELAVRASNSNMDSNSIGGTSANPQYTFRNSKAFFHNHFSTALRSYFKVVRMALI
jgi:hypothetical protein